MRKIWLFSP